jgi:hypothetical protein
MKWFKHFSNAKYDAKVMRLIRKYGLKGFGLYFAMIEYAAFQLTTDNPIPDIEENSQDIANFFGEDTILIEEIMLFCINEELLEQDENTGRMMCMKLLCHLDNTMSNNPEVKKILDNFKKLEETYSNLKQIRLDKNRLDKIKLDKNRLESPDKKKKRPKQINKVEYAKYVFMEDKEYKKLIDRYGEEETKRAIAKLNNYKGSHGKKYKSDYRAILSWVIDSLKIKEIDKKTRCPECGMDTNGSLCKSCGYIFEC